MSNTNNFVFPDLETLFDAGVHFGHQSKKWHPRMKPWIYAEKDGVHIFDLEKTLSQLQKAYDFAFELGRNKKTLIVVGTKKQAREEIIPLAEDAGAMYIVNRWMGGLVSNWHQVSKSLKRMLEIESGLAGNRYQKLTKYERLMLAKEQSRLERFFGGLRQLKNKPDALLVIDTIHEKNAVKEAICANIPVIAIIDSNSDPEGIFCPIPANDDAVSSIRLLTQVVLQGYKDGRQGVHKTNAVETKEEKKEIKTSDEPVKAEAKEKKQVAVKTTPEKKSSAKKSATKKTNKSTKNTGKES